MPEMYFHIRWPDGARERCYSPSLVVKDFLTPGQSYPLDDFVGRSREALQIASERVRQKYGFGCAHANLQLEQIEQAAARFADTSDARVTVELFEE